MALAPRPRLNLTEQQSPTPDHPDLERARSAITGESRKQDSGSTRKFLAGFIGSVTLSAIIFMGGGWYHLFPNVGTVSWLVLLLGSAELVTSIVLAVRLQRFRAGGIWVFGSFPVSAWVSGVYCLHPFCG